MNLQSRQADNTPSNNSVEYDITKDLAKRKCYHCQQEGHYAKFCPQKNQQLHHRSGQSQITTGLPPVSVSDAQPERSIFMRMTNEGVMTDYPRSTKWRMCHPHGHARDATLDALTATPWLRNRSLCPLCNKNDSITS